MERNDVECGEINPRWSWLDGELVDMNRKNYQKSADTVVGTLLETLNSYNLPEAQINTLKRIVWAELDKQFGRFVHE